MYHLNRGDQYLSFYPSSENSHKKCTGGLWKNEYFCDTAITTHLRMQLTALIVLWILVIFSMSEIPATPRPSSDIYE